MINYVVYLPRKDTMKLLRTKGNIINFTFVSNFNRCCSSHLKSPNDQTNNKSEDAAKAVTSTDTAYEVTPDTYSQFGRKDSGGIGGKSCIGGRR